jgi:phospholipase/carboxylesterase
MKIIESTLVHLVEEPRNPRGDRFPTIIYVHGRGADEEDLLGLSSYLDGRLMSISVRAPYPFPFSGGFTWYEILPDLSADPVMFRSAYDRLSAFVTDACVQYPIDTKRLFLFGFSMGTVMAYALSLTRPGLARGVIANSGYLAEKVDLAYQWDKLGDTEFFVTHGTQDPVLPVHVGRKSKDLLVAAGAKLHYREYSMGHQISEESLRDIAVWLKERLDATEKE